ncbi:MAG: hypothetical protein M3336_03695 [Chloroflexota bacterium]|nr:hypothetical protein [Chloroflexota bacterium]
MTRVDEYRASLRQLQDWDSYLTLQSGLPGPRANLELLEAVASSGSIEQFRRWLRLDAAQAPSNDPREFLAACGAAGLGHLVAAGQRELLEELRGHASDARWRVREAVAIGLQRVGARDMAWLLEQMRTWSAGTWLERRAVVAALCEPALLRNAPTAQAVLELLDRITASLLSAPDRRASDFKVLRQALAYGWSVAVAALPGVGRPLLQKWLACADPDVAWLARKNLQTARLKRMDPAWVERWSR